MSGPARIAVFDVGKTNAKLVVLEALSGREIAMRRMGNRVLPGPPYPHYDIEALWRFLIEALGEFAISPGFDAISITTHGACAALVDADGSLVLPVLDYEHTYPDTIRTAYDALRPPFAETFSPRLSAGLNLGAQLHYQKTAFPEDFARVRHILPYPQYWAMRLTGIAAAEATSLGCHTDLWAPQSGTYSTLVERLGIRDCLPPLRSAFDILGPVTEELAVQIGLAAPVPVTCGIHDSNASLLPHLIGRKPPFSVVSTGTWAVAFAVGGDLGHLDPARDSLANVDAYGRAVPSARFMAGREFEMLKAQLGPFDPDAALGALESVIAGGIMLTPNLAAGSGPFPGRQARWVGAHDSGPATRWAAACLYLALMTETCLSLIGAGGPSLIEGPFAENRPYLAALRGLTGRPVLALAGSTGTSLGAACLAGARGTSPAAEVPDMIDRQRLARYREAWRAACGESFHLKSAVQAE